MNDSYYNYDLPIQTLISRKFKVKPILKKKHRKYHLIRVTLFIKKIWDYEPNLVILICQIHNYNYSTIVELSSIKLRRPIRMNACISDFDYEENNSDSEASSYDCHCQSCDIYGSYLLKPYRISKKNIYKIMNKN